MDIEMYGHREQRHKILSFTEYWVNLRIKIQCTGQPQSKLSWVAKMVLISIQEMKKVLGTAVGWTCKSRFIWW